MEAVSGSLKKVFYGENNKFIQNERFVKIHGSGDAQMLNKEGAPVNIRAYKTDSFDKEEHRCGSCRLILMTCRRI